MQLVLSDEGLIWGSNPASQAHIRVPGVSETFVALGRQAHSLEPAVAESLKRGHGTHAPVLPIEALKVDGGHEEHVVKLPAGVMLKRVWTDSLDWLA